MLTRYRKGSYLLYALQTTPGYELGKKNGQEAYEEGTGHDSKCQPNDSLSYCAGYKAGYEAGWVAAATLGDN
jgi:hypothetical protein